MLVESADVILVYPALGGGGRAHPPYNSVRIEAVLADPLAELPEVTRIGWLLAQLNQDLPRYSERVVRGRLAVVAPLAMIPAVLAAAEAVELARCEPPTIHRAVESWSNESKAGAQPVIVAETLVRWWETYRESSISWVVALAALDQLLLPSATPSDRTS